MLVANTARENPKCILPNSFYRDWQYNITNRFESFSIRASARRILIIL
jgi:hypothetical protein